MRYQKIHCQIWHDEKFRSLNDDQQKLFLYVLTSPHSNSLGAYVLPKAYIMADLKWSSRRVNAIFAQLIDVGVIAYDHLKSIIVIKNHLKHNSLENPNQAKSAMKAIKSLPKSYIYKEIDLKQLTKEFHKQLIELIRKHYTVTVPETKEKEKEKEKDLNSINGNGSEEIEINAAGLQLLNLLKIKIPDRE